MDSVKIDARGLSCPQPVLLTMQALKQQPAPRYEILVDNPTARQNVTRFLEKSGKTVTVTENGGDILLAAE